jgi:hypothetical protein
MLRRVALIRTDVSEEYQPKHAVNTQRDSVASYC